MAVDIRLRKPAYAWFALPYGDGSELRLSPQIQDWLDARKISYNCYSMQEWCRSESKTYLYFHINIHDDSDAMLFKLTWV